MWVSIFSRKNILIASCLLLLTSCQPAPPTQPTAASTSTLLPTATETSTPFIPTATLVEIPTIAVPPSEAVPVPLSKRGPWLVYQHQYSQDSEHFIVNQDGTGRVRVVPNCDTGNIERTPLNQLVSLPNTLYLARPAFNHWQLVDRDWPSCFSDYAGTEEKGLLASIYDPPDNQLPELHIFELPEGSLRDQIPLFNCSGLNVSCETGDVDLAPLMEMKWSPNGRYLAFSAMLDGPSSDLYMYDSQTGNVLRLTTGPDSVAQIDWSPDGQWIIMGELHDSGYPFTTSVWAVSAADNEMRRLYELPDPYPQGILGWLDDSRFIGFGGTSLRNALDLPAYNLHLVNIESGTVTPLFHGSFYTADLIVSQETIVLGVYMADAATQGGGTYLFSVSDPTLRYIGPDLYQPDWDESRQLFVTHQSCENDATGTKAFDTQGRWQCAHIASTQSYASPDKKWEVDTQDGTWLHTTEGEPVQISQESAIQVIWRPDSQGFFMLEGQILYYVSVPMATRKVVDAHVDGKNIWYMWLNGK